jgi:hypothetical protein
MDTINPADAKGRLGDLVDRVEADAFLVAPVCGRRFDRFNGGGRPEHP